MYRMHSVFSTECEKPAHRHTQYSRLACSAPGTHDPGHSPSLLTDADADLAMLSCTILSFFLYFSFSFSLLRESHRYICHVTPRSGSGLSTSDLITHRPRHHTLSWHKLRLLYGCMHTSARRIFVQLKRQHPRHAGRNPYRDMGCINHRVGGHDLRYFYPVS